MSTRLVAVFALLGLLFMGVAIIAGDPITWLSLAFGTWLIPALDAVRVPT